MFMDSTFKSSKHFLTKRTRYLRRLTVFLVALSIVLGFGFGDMKPASAAGSLSPSLAYVQAMGKG
jgi:hypothetical protein